MTTASVGRKSIAWLTIGSVALLNVGVAFAAFFKDIWLALYLGTSKEADALTFAFFIPDALGNNLFAAAIGVVSVPLFSKAISDGAPDALGVAVAGALRSTLLWAGAIAAIAAAAAPWIGRVAGIEVATLTRDLLWVMCPTFLLFPLLTLGTAGLQSTGRFLRAGAAPFLFNAMFLASVWASDRIGADADVGAFLIASGITAGVAVSAWFVAPPLVGALPYWRRTSERPSVVRSALPYAAVLGSVQFVSFFERSIAAALETGAVAALNYAYRLSQFPLWTLIAAVTVVILPELAQDAERRDLERQRATLSRAMTAGLYCTLPTAALLFLLREPTAALLFQRGAFDAHSLRLTTAVLEGYALSIPGQALFVIGLRYFLARGKLRDALIVASASAAVTIAMDAALLPRYGIAGIGYGAAVGASLQAVGMLWLLDRRARVLERMWRIRATKLLAANAPAVAAVVYATGHPVVAKALQGGWSRIVALGALCIAYVAIFATVDRILNLRRGEGNDDAR
jgi:putative peptidoglycan lipid II flippase